MANKIIIGIVLLIAAFILGVSYALTISKPQNAPSAAQARIMEMRLGNIVKNNQGQTYFKEMSEFKTNDSIAMKVTLSSTDTLSLPVRLLDANDNLINLSPDHITIKNGANNFCCWSIRNAGKYTLQIFRPEGVITAIPIQILREFGT